MRGRARPRWRGSRRGRRRDHGRRGPGRGRRRGRRRTDRRRPLLPEEQGDGDDHAPESRVPAVRRGQGRVQERARAVHRVARGAHAMKRMAFAALVVLLGAAPGVALADPLDASKPLVCSIAEVAECDGTATCSATSLEQIDLPPLWRVDFAAKQLASADGQRTSPIAALETLDAALVLQGHQSGRGWTLVVDRKTGHLSGSAADAEGAFVLAGSCTPDGCRPDGEFALSLVRGDPLLRLQRRIGLVPAHGLGVARRALALALLAWLPLAAWALLAGRWSGAGEPLLQHFGVHVRCLIAIPLLVL